MSEEGINQYLSKFSNFVDLGMLETKGDDIYFGGFRRFNFDKNKILTASMFSRKIHCIDFIFRNVEQLDNEIFKFLKPIKASVEIGESKRFKLDVDSQFSFTFCDISRVQVPYEGVIFISSCDKTNNLNILKNNINKYAYIYRSVFKDLTNINDGLENLMISECDNEFNIGKFPEKLKFLCMSYNNGCPKDILKIFTLENVELDICHNHPEAFIHVETAIKEKMDIYSAASLLIENGFEEYANV